jgi:TetR/AcrR family transcriptional regulator
MKYGVYIVLAPMLFLAMWKHSLGPCTTGLQLVPEEYLAAQVETLLYGLSIAPTSHPASAEILRQEPMDDLAQ